MLELRPAFRRKGSCYAFLSQASGQKEAEVAEPHDCLACRTALAVGILERKTHYLKVNPPWGWATLVRSLTCPIALKGMSPHRSSNFFTKFSS